MFAGGYHYPLLAVVGLYLSLPPLGAPTYADAWTTAIAFPVGCYAAVLAVRAQSAYVNVTGVLLTGLYFCLILYMIPGIVSSVPATLQYWLGG